MSELIQQVKSKANAWLSSEVIDAETKALVKTLLAQQDSKELIDNFYKDLEFGTGGLRGVMGAGSNCMNRYTVGIATQDGELRKRFTGSGGDSSENEYQ